MHGILHVDIQQGAYTTDSFNDFIRGLFLHTNPFPGPQSVLIMDNASIHKSDELAQMCEEQYVQPSPQIYTDFQGYLGVLDSNFPLPTPQTSIQ